jgi:hypothetical protein
MIGRVPRARSAPNFCTIQFFHWLVLFPSIWPLLHFQLVYHPSLCCDTSLHSGLKTLYNIIIKKTSSKHYLKKEGNIWCVRTLRSRKVENTDDAHFRISQAQLQSPLSWDIVTRQRVIGVRRCRTSWWKLDTQTLYITLPRFSEKSGTDYVVMMKMMMMMIIIIIN